MISFALTCLFAISGAPQWIPAPQPVGARLRSATILSDGAWVGEDTSYNSWISRDRGATWDRLSDPSLSANSWIFGDGVVVTATDNQEPGYHRYDPPSRSWVPMVFDRKIVSSDPGVMENGREWNRRDGGLYQLAILRSDSVLSFRSTDSARTWTSIAALPNSVAPGGVSYDNVMFAGSRFWISDTLKRIFRSKMAGSPWLEIAYPPLCTGEVHCELFDSLPSGKWIILVIDSAQKISGLATKDLGSSWDAYDISTPESLPSFRTGLSEGWTWGLGFPSDTPQAFIRQGNSGNWMVIPNVPKNSFRLGYVDQNRIYATGDSGLVSLDLKAVRNLPRKIVGALSWRLDGNTLVVDGLGSNQGWTLVDPAGRNLAFGTTKGTTGLRLPLSSRQGLVLLRIQGIASQTIAIVLP